MPAQAVATTMVRLVSAPVRVVETDQVKISEYFGGASCSPCPFPVGDVRTHTPDSIIPTQTPDTVGLLTPSTPPLLDTDLGSARASGGGLGRGMADARFR